MMAGRQAPCAPLSTLGSDTDVGDRMRIGRRHRPETVWGLPSFKCDRADVRMGPVELDSPSFENWDLSPFTGQDISWMEWRHDRRPPYKELPNEGVCGHQ